MELDPIRDFIRLQILEDETIVIADDDDLLLSEILDSLSVTRLVDHLEERTGIPIPPEDITLENFQTLRCIGEYLGSRQSGAEA